jgi:hypothetical protein
LLGKTTNHFFFKKTILRAVLVADLVACIPKFYRKKKLKNSRWRLYSTWRFFLASFSFEKFIIQATKTTMI